MTGKNGSPTRHGDLPPASRNEADPWLANVSADMEAYLILAHCECDGRCECDG